MHRFFKKKFMFYLKELQRQGELPAAASLPKWLQRQELCGSEPGSFFQVSNVGRGAQAPGPFPLLSQAINREKWSRQD